MQERGPGAANASDAPVPRATSLRDCLRDLGVTHLVGLPDNASAPLWRLLRAGSQTGTRVGSETGAQPGSPARARAGSQAGSQDGAREGPQGVDSESRMRGVSVTREGEAFAVAAGLWVGGATPVVMVQNTGLLEAGDALRGTAVRMGVPLLVLVTMRGFAKLHAAGLDPASPPPEDAWPRELLVRPDVDSVALLTEPTLRAWGIPWERLASDDLSPVRGAWARAREEERPVAVLITRGLR